VADKAQCAQILKIALSSTFHYRQDMISVPKCLSREPLEPPFNEKPQPMGSARTAQFPVGSASVDSADRTDASVPLQNLLTKVARVGAEAPFVYAPIRAESETPRRNFEITPAAERPAVRPFRQGGAIGEAARDGPRGAQMIHNIFRIKCFGRFLSDFFPLAEFDSRWPAYSIPPRPRRLALVRCGSFHLHWRFWRF
jgi:hypothetical protein